MRVERVRRASRGPAHASADPVLECIDLPKRFGAVESVRGISFHISEGAATTIAAWQLRRALTA